MNDLSHEAKSMLAAARSDGVPTPSRRHAIKRAVLVRVATLTTATVGAGAAGATSVASKLVLAGVVAGTVAGGTVGLWKLHAGRQGHALSPAVTVHLPSHRPPAVAKPASLALAPAAAELAPVAPPRARPDLPRAVSRIPGGQRHALEHEVAPPPSLALVPLPVASSSKPPDQPLAREVALLERAQQALHDGTPALALHLLADYDRAFPEGELREERRAIAAIAACQLGTSPSARGQARAFLRDAPASLLRDRVEAACAARLGAAQRQQADDSSMTPPGTGNKAR